MIARILRLGLLLAAALLVIIAPLQSQGSDSDWQARGGPLAFVTHLAADPATPDFLFVFVAQSVNRNNDRTQTQQGYMTQTWAPYISVDGGDSWQAASNDLAHIEPTALLITPGTPASTIWVGSAEHGLFRSDNGGRTWRPLIVPGIENQRVIALAQGQRGRLQALTLDNTRYPASHLFTSTDGGANWEQRLVQNFSGSPATQVTDLVADPFESGRLYAVTYGGLFFTDNGGFSWQESPVILPEGAFPGGETVMAADPTQRGRLFLINRSTNLDGSDQITMYQSLDGAESWTVRPSVFDQPARSATALRPLRLRLDPINRRQFFLAANNGLWVTTDAGENWESVGAALEGVTVADVFAHPRQRGHWIAIGSGGMWRTANAGSQWRALGAGLPPASNLRSIIALPDRPETLVALNGGANPLPAGTQPVWRSIDGGQQWLPAMRGLAGVNLSRLYTNPDDPSAIFAISASGFARSEEGGRSWLHISLATTPLHLAFGADPGQLYLATVDGLRRSTDRGNSWQKTVLNEKPVAAVAAAPNGHVFAVEGMNLLRSVDAGQTWAVVAPVPAGEVAELQAHPNVNDFLALLMRWGGLYISVDGGKTWVRSDQGIPAGTRWRGPQPEEPAGPNLLALYINPQNSTTWWAARDGGGVYRSEDNGRTWKDAGADLGDNLVQSFASSEYGLLAGTSTLGLVELAPGVTVQSLPSAVDARIEILWPHDAASVATAQQANMGLRLYESRTSQPPPCAWTPNVEVWMAHDAEPLRRLDLASQRTAQDHPFPFWELNDIDVTWANDPAHKLIFLARVIGAAESFSSPWIHAADARTYLPEPPVPTGLTDARPAAIDALIGVVWPHDASGNYVSAEQANLVNISATLFARDTRLALTPDHLSERVWLVGSLDNQVGRRLLVGEQRIVQGDGFSFTTFEFNNVDVSLARDPAHHWTFWLDVPDADAASNVWVHGIDARTRAPLILEPIAGCRP